MFALVNAVVVYARMIKVSHSIFALPFAFSGGVLAAVQSGVRPAQVGLITVAMVSARSAAMGFNRLVDRDIDGANPRTALRELPRGAISVRAVVVLVALSSLIFLGAASRLNELCLYLSPLVLVVLLLYSWTKRFTWACHLFLGLCLGGAPVGAWVAITGGFDSLPFFLGLAVLSWVAGFDIIYACQDRNFDVGRGLYSMPACFGVERALLVSRLLHSGAVIFWVVVGLEADLGRIYFVGVVVVAGLLVWEHRLVTGGGLEEMGLAFQTINSIISITYLVFMLSDLAVGVPGASGL